MKTIRVEIFQDPPRERVLVDGVVVPGVTFEVAFLDAPSTSMTLHEFVTRVGTTSVAGQGDDNINHDQGKEKPPLESAEGTTAVASLAASGGGSATEITRKGEGQ